MSLVRPAPGPAFLPAEVKEALGDSGAVISCLGVYGNPLADDQMARATRAAWEMMFNAVPLDNIGLEWEPAHQMCALTDPLPQLRKYVKRVFHLHGKDATVLWDVIREYGIGGCRPFAFHRTPDGRRGQSHFCGLLPQKLGQSPRSPDSCVSRSASSRRHFFSSSRKS
jgi:hypothetical protein